MARPLTSSPAFRSLAVLLIAALGVALMDSTAAADERLDGILHAWVAGAADVEAPSLATARARFGRELSAHQLEAAVFLWTPDSVASLDRRFDWTISSHGRNVSVLNGVPRDDVDRAFISTVEVRWNATTRRPISIRFAGGRRIEFATIRRASDSEVDHVVFYQAAAESGAEAIADNDSEVRTASAVIGESVTNIDLPVTMMDVDEVLDRWAAASVFHGPWVIAGEIYEYDNTFGVEYGSRVMMRGNGAGTIEICTSPNDVPEGTVNDNKLDDSGMPYEVRGGEASAVVYTPDFVIVADPVDLSLYRIDNSVFDEFPWYKHPLSTPDSVNLSLSVDADELREQFIWEITRRTDEGLWLQATPRTEDVARCVTSVAVILNSDTFLPNAIQSIQDSHEQVVVLHGRGTPIALSASTILAGYAEYTESRVPQKGERETEPDANETRENSPTLSECVHWAILLCL